MKVKVYFNLHRKLWSVLSMTPKGWRLYCHTNSLILENVTFKVSEAGRQRVLREQHKNVHAFAIGDLVDLDGSGYTGHLPCASYNPYKAGHFVHTATGERLDRTSEAIFTSDRKVRIPQWEPCLSSTEGV